MVQITNAISSFFVPKNIMLLMGYGKLSIPLFILESLPHFQISSGSEKEHTARFIRKLGSGKGADVFSPVALASARMIFV